MRDDHIIQLLEERPLGEFSVTEIQRIHAHTGECPECRQVFEAAQISTRLLQERASVAVEAPAFFQTRVMAAIREKNLGRGQAPEVFGFRKMWQSARILIASMALVVATLTAVNLFSEEEPSQPSSSSFPTAADNELAAAVIYEDDPPLTEEMTYSQVLNNLYDSDAPEAPKPEDTDGRKQ